MMEGIDAERAALVLGKAAADVIADMAFIDAQPRSRAPAASADPGAEEPQLDSRVAIDALRPVSCRIELQTRPGFLAKVMDILFAEPTEAGKERDAEREDAVLEMLNVIAGSFLTGYFGPGTEIRLELPRYVFYSDGLEGDEIARLDFDAEGFPLRIILSSIRYRY